MPVAVDWGGENQVIWKSTAGMIVEKHKSTLLFPSWQFNFARDAVAHLKSGSLQVSKVGLQLTAEETTALHQIVEMLTLVDQPRTGE
ncbi:MAG: hypothetical protein HYS13_24800 [Planctomycetia bacterium]|nr:hypothetical protein [Planctomycetia bacterium]